MNALTKQAASFSESMIPQCLENAAMDPTLFDTYGVKRGLRDKAGNGVVAGLTNISDVSAYWFDEQGNKLRKENFPTVVIISTILSMALYEKNVLALKKPPISFYSPNFLMKKNWQNLLSFSLPYADSQLILCAMLS